LSGLVPSQGNVINLVGLYPAAFTISLPNSSALANPDGDSVLYKSISFLNLSS
jgi:hypothetical protein